MPTSKKKKIVREEILVKGTGVSPGITIGPAHVLMAMPTEIIEYTLENSGEIRNELHRFQQALEITRDQLDHQIDEAKKKYGKEYGQILESHYLILDDEEMLKGTQRLIQHQHMNVEAAFIQVMDKFKTGFLRSTNEYLRERAIDIEDVKRRVLNNLLGKQKQIIIDEPSILVADAVKPSDIIGVERQKLLGFISESGSALSHFAIIARSMNLPAVVGIANVTGFITTGDLIILDGTNGELILNPEPSTLEKYRKKLEQIRKEVQTLASLAPLPSITQDGRSIKLMANIEITDEVPNALALGAEGIGLYRTEYLLFSRASLPSEEEQYEQYRMIAEAINPLPVVMRTFDVGGDKIPVELLARYGYVHEDNPFLGWRAIRIALECEEFFKPQIRAMLRVSAQYPIQIMLPMITSIEEIRAAKTIIETCKQELRREGHRFNEWIKIGIMIETPAAAVVADTLAPESDFFSIGTNDLVQYTLAADRGNPKVASSYSCFHPAILRLIQMTIEAGERHNTPVSMCGEMAGNPNATILLIGLGLKEFSVYPPALPRIKKIIRHTTFDYAQSLARAILEMPDVKTIEKTAALEARKIIGKFG